MGFVHTDFRFKKRGAIFTVSTRVPTEFSYLLDLAGLAQGAPLMRDMLIEFIEKLRPDLAGCDIWFMDFTPWRQEWDIGVTHRTLPEVSEGECFPKMELVVTENL